MRQHESYRMRQASWLKYLISNATEGIVAGSAAWTIITELAGQLNVHQRMLPAQKPFAAKPADEQA